MTYNVHYNKATLNILNIMWSLYVINHSVIDSILLTFLSSLGYRHPHGLCNPAESPQTSPRPPDASGCDPDL